MTLPEEQVLEKLNAVSTAKRLANMVRFVSIFRSARSTRSPQCRSTYFGSSISYRFGHCHDYDPLRRDAHSGTSFSVWRDGWATAFHHHGHPLKLTLTFGQELHDSNFGKREEVHKIKKQKRKSDLVG